MRITCTGELRLCPEYSKCLANGFLGGPDGKESAWVRKIPWRREWQPTPVSLPGEFRGQKNLVDYNPWGCEELDTTEQLSLTPRKNHCDVTKCKVLKSLSSK